MSCSEGGTLSDANYDVGREPSSGAPAESIKDKPQPKSAMDRVWGANKLLEECIEAREQLDLANAKILSARRKHDAMAASPSGRGVRDDNDSEEDAALAAAVPVAREFCDKMADLADVAPGLSSLLAEITETPMSGIAEGGAPYERRKTSTGREGIASFQPLSGGGVDSVEEVLKVVPLLAQLLSFDHLRASEPTARNLVQALVNLYRGAWSGAREVVQQSSDGSPSEKGAAATSSNHDSGPLEMNANTAGSSKISTSLMQKERTRKKTAAWVIGILRQAFAPKVYGGKLVRSTGLDGLLAKKGVDAAQYNTALQNELLRNTEVLQSLATDALASNRCNSVPSTRTEPDLPTMPGHEHEAGLKTTRKRPRSNPPEGTHTTPNACVWAWESPINPDLHTPHSNAQSAVDSVPRTRKKRDEKVAFLLGGVPRIEGVYGKGDRARDSPAASLSESVVNAFCHMAGTGTEGSDDPMQILHARLRRHAYQIFPAEENRESALESRSEASLLADIVSDVRKCGRGLHQEQLNPLSTFLERTSSASFRDMSAHPTLPPPWEGRRYRESTSAAISHYNHPPPMEWQRRVRHCILSLRRRPLLCPDNLLRETGARPSLSSEACVRGAMAGAEDLKILDPGLDGGSSKGGFQLSEACLLVGLDMVKEAVLEGGGGEAVAGYLRAWRTVRSDGTHGAGKAVRVREDSASADILSGIDGDAREAKGRPVALASGGRGHAAGEEVTPLVELLEKAPCGCAENALGVLVWALQDVGQQHEKEPQTRDDQHSPSRPRSFGAELWLLVLGYRHWLMVAMIHVVSARACTSCEGLKSNAAIDGDDTMKKQRRSQPQPGSCDNGETSDNTPALWLLAWYASGGHTKPASFLEENIRAVQDIAPTLHETGPGGTVSSSEAVSVVPGLSRAEQLGQGRVGAIFGPCLAAAWLLTSREALRSCEYILENSLLPKDDIQAAFRSGVPHEVSRRSSLEGVLQGLAALEDMAFLCQVTPPMSHIHQGQDLTTLLQRVRAWMSALNRHTLLDKLESRGNSDVASSGVCDFDDFCFRRDSVCRQLDIALAKVGASGRSRRRRR